MNKGGRLSFFVPGSDSDRGGKNMSLEQLDKALEKEIPYTGDIFQDKPW